MFTRPKYKVYLISNCIRFGEIKTVTFIIKLDSTNCLIQTDNIHELINLLNAVILTNIPKLLCNAL